MGLNDRPFVRWVNAFFSELAKVPLLGSVIRRRLIVIRYVGRRSGKTFETPVSYSRRGQGAIRRVIYQVSQCVSCSAGSRLAGLKSVPLV